MCHRMARTSPSTTATNEAPPNSGHPMSMNSFHSRSSQFRPRPVKAAATVAEHGLGGSRVDQLLVQQGKAASRTQAQRLIDAGRVSWAEGLIRKASLVLPDSTALTVQADEQDCYVSRGGIKLAGALQHCGLSVAGRLCLDVGQSTGGFTDCLLQAGATRVIGVDVGHTQLDNRLRTDPRVVCVEGINARTLTVSDLPDMPDDSKRFDLIVADLSFISLRLVIQQFPALLKDEGDMLLLVKPQFEVGPANVGRGGIVRDKVLYTQVAENIRHCAQACKLRVVDYFNSPITGTDGNREFFLWTRHENH